MGVTTVNRLRGCPQVYYENCRNAQRCCQQCSADLGRPTGQIYYDPIRLELGEHPYVQLRQQRLEQQRQRRQRVRAGLRLERQRTRDIARTTLRSGAVGHDGDAQLLRGLLQLDYKLRRAQDFRLAYADYQRGLQQGTNGWYLVIERRDGTQAGLVCLTERAFEQLLAQAYGRFRDDPTHAGGSG